MLIPNPHYASQIKEEDRKFGGFEIFMEFVGGVAILILILTR